MLTLWTRDFVCATLLKFCSSSVFSLLTATMATYAFDVYSATPVAAGVVVGAFIMGALVIRFLMGRYTDLIGRKRLLVAGSVLFCAAMVAYALPVGLGGFVLVRFVHGMSFGILSNTTTVVATGIIPKQRYGEGIALFSLSSTVSAGLGPFVGVAILQTGNHALLFSACFAISLAGVVLAAVLDVKEVELSDEQRDELAKPVGFRNAIAREAVPVSAVAFLTNACYGGVLGYVNPYAESHGIEGALPFFFVALTLALLVSRPALGKVMDGKGDNAAVYPAMASYIVGLVMLSCWHSHGGMVVAAVFVSVGQGCLFSCCQAIVAKATPDYRMGMATSTFYMFVDAGQGVGPALLGSVVPAVGYSGMYAVAAAVVLAAFALYVSVHGRKAGVRFPAG